jgi:hypothetical protein
MGDYQMIVKCKFDPGNIAITPTLMKKVDADYAFAALTQHLMGKWGVLDKQDWEANNAALKDGGRLLSAYPLPNDPDNFWIITEGEGHDRVTTMLLPSDY